MTPELQQKILDWKAKALRGEMTLDDMKEAILVMRGDRLAAAQNESAPKATKSKKPTRSADELLAGL